MIIDYNNKIIEYSKYRVTEYPVRHRAKVPFNPSFRLNIKYRTVISRIREADAALGRMILGAADYRDLVIRTYSAQAHWSVNIEGNDLPIREIDRLAVLFAPDGIRQGLEEGAGTDRLRSYTAGNGFGLPWDLRLVMGLHSLLADDGGRSGEAVGFRTGETSFIGRDGFEYFTACHPHAIKDELEGLINWLRYSPFDELITSVIFFHEFESIHPFRNSNGRTGRMLLRILLREFGLKNSRLCMVERELLRDPGMYYSLLIYTEATLDYCPLVMYVAESLLKAYEDAVAVFSEKDLAPGMDDDMIAIVAKARTVGGFSAGDAARWLSGPGGQTVRNKLNLLAEADVLEKSGNTRSQRFCFKDPFRDLKSVPAAPV